MPFRGMWLCAIVVIGAACAPTIPAPARLVFATPAPDAVVGTFPRVIQLHFSQDLLPGQSTANLLDEASQPLASEAYLEPGDARALTVQTTQGGTGRFTVYWRTLSAETRTEDTGKFSFSVEPGQPSQPRISVSPGLSEVQQPVTVSGSGFDSRASIELTIGDDDERLGTVQADATGAFSEDVTIPGDVPFGQQPVWAREDGGSIAGTGIEVRWGGWPPLRVFTQAAPGPNQHQVTFTVTGSNRSDYVLDGVRVRLAVPDGSSLISASEGAQIDGGALVWDEGVVDRTSLTPRSAIFSVSAERPVVGGAWVEFRHRRTSGCIGDQCIPAFVDETYSASGPVTPAP